MDARTQQTHCSRQSHSAQPIPIQLNPTRLTPIQSTQSTASRPLTGMWSLVYAAGSPGQVNAYDGAAPNCPFTTTTNRSVCLVPVPFHLTSSKAFQKHRPPQRLLFAPASPHPHSFRAPPSHTHTQRVRVTARAQPPRVSFADAGPKSRQSAPPPAYLLPCRMCTCTPLLRAVIGPASRVEYPRLPSAPPSMTTTTTAAGEGDGCINDKGPVYTARIHYS
jgi:hypothetical protein